MPPGCKQPAPAPLHAPFGYNKNWQRGSVGRLWDSQNWLQAGVLGLGNRNSSCLLFFMFFFNFYFFGGVVGRAAGLGFCCCTRAFSSCSEQGLLPKCVGFSLQRLLLLWGRSPGHALKNELSGCGLRALKHRLGSCGPQASFPQGRWDLPAPGIKPMSLLWQADSQPLD